MIEVQTKLYDADEVETYTEFLKGLVKERQRSATASVVNNPAPALPTIQPFAKPVVDEKQIELPLADAKIPELPALPPVTEQDVVVALRSFVNAKGIAEARAILSEAGANRVADLAADKYAEVLAKLTA